MSARWKSIAGAVLIFVFGACAGALVTGVSLKNRFQRQLERGPEGIAPLIVRRLDSELDLSAAQKEEISRIVIRGQREIREARRTILPRVLSVLERSDEEIRTVLTEEQRTRYRGMSERFKRRFQLEE